ncbi:hypothetical protein VOLCADRAFT_86651 [Volvox carteri f. nagariensis]|uniref:Uncharacterized protein n=1 Tax=Volvox carteri f. nagariensis TaxID=3068 RepID=D8TJ83_VOLCA|nr:uncharacterized protein VOLCADRAFT_86651 [Volvox carteri f. nagariensis]EFJ52330.1 hypothetical protein VOLCADRAFT_86651 [Volvox carteri f. nagariensis]|eukprot:XP_002946403.1 hypothetical protein VOLCADRAFT_86651 [Volvox carteri f. nagariensis]
MVDEERKADNRLAGTARFAPGIAAAELPQAARTSTSVTLASLRCLSMAPMHGPYDMTAVESFQQLAHHSPSGNVRAMHYTAYLRRKVSSAVSSLSRFMQDWDGTDLDNGFHGQLSSALRSPGEGDHRCQAQQYATGARPSVSLAAAARKRTASYASFEELESLRHTCTRSSSLQSPRPSSLQRLVTLREGAAGEAPGAVRLADASVQPPCLPLLKPLSPLSCQQEAQQLAAQAYGDERILNLIFSVNPRMQEVVEATAAATAAQWQKQFAALPAVNTVLKRWPVASLAQQLAGNAAERDVHRRSSCGGGGSNSSILGRADGRPPQMKHVLTPLPRRSADVRLSQMTRQERKGTHGAGAVLPLEVLSAPLRPDTCQARTELWDLVHLNVPFTMCPAGRAGLDEGGLVSPLDAATVAKSKGTCGRLDGTDGCCGCAKGQGGHEKVESEASQDDPDVFISTEGLVCLASLACGRNNGGGWRLPLLVRPRQLHYRDDGQVCNSPDGLPGDTDQLPALYFTEPLHDAPRLMLDSWSRMCACALAARQRDGPGHAATDNVSLGGSEGAQDKASESEDCPCCQQDEWQLGELSLLVLSHSCLGLVSGSGSLIPAQLVALASTGGHSGRAARQQASQAVIDILAERYIELACRAELLRGPASTLAVVVDAVDGTLLAQQYLDSGAIRQLAAEQRAEEQVQSCWHLVHKLLDELRRLPPGPYMLHMNASSRRLELLGVRR